MPAESFCAAACCLRCLVAARPPRQTQPTFATKMNFPKEIAIVRRMFANFPEKQQSFCGEFQIPWKNRGFSTKSANPLEKRPPFGEGWLVLWKISFFPADVCQHSQGVCRFAAQFSLLSHRSRSRGQATSQQAAIKKYSKISSSYKHGPSQIYAVVIRRLSRSQIAQRQNVG